MTNRAASIYDFTLAANGSFVLPVEGSYYRILSSTGAVQVRRDGGSGLSPLQAGQGERDQEFKRLTITDRTGVANVGLIIVGDSTFVDDRITGEVSIIDGEKARSLASALYASCPGINGVVGNYSIAQLWNPPGSGKHVIVTQGLFSASSAGGILLSFGTVARTTNVTATALRNKLASGAVGLGQVRIETNVTAPSGNLWSAYCQGNTNVPWFPKGPIVLPPGVGLEFSSNVVNSSITTSFEHYEENI